MFIFFRLPCGFHPTSCNKDAKPENHATLSQQTDNMTHKHTEKTPCECVALQQSGAYPSITIHSADSRFLQACKNVQNCVFESLFWLSFLRILISCKIRAKNRLQKVWFFDVLFAYTMNFSYICIVDQKKEARTLAMENLLVGRQKTVPCPARKSTSRKSARVNE